MTKHKRREAAVVYTLNMAATEEKQAIDAAVASVLDDFKGKFSLKKEQKLALEQFLQKKDVFAILPTGFGKSLIYQCKVRHPESCSDWL